MKTNTTKDQRDYLIELAEDEYQRFVEMPIGDNIEIFPTMDISCNPIVKYKNNESSICAFASLASALHYRGHVAAADALMDKSKIIDEEGFFKHNALRMILETIDSGKKFKPFRKRYQKFKLNKNAMFELQDNEDLDIQLIVLQQSDGHKSHAVALTGNYIFDCNTTNALPRTKDGIDCCCGADASFVAIHSGYKWKANSMAKIPYEK